MDGIVPIKTMALLKYGLLDADLAKYHEELTKRRLCAKKTRFKFIKFIDMAFMKSG
jgi:hypothetical protein